VRKLPVVGQLATLLFVARHAVADPAPFVEYAGGVGGTVVGGVLGILATSPCGIEQTKQGACEGIRPIGIALAASAGSSLGVIAVGSAFDRRGSVPGAFAGGATGTLLTAGVWLLVWALDRELEHAGSTAAIISSALVLPSLGATLGYEALR
jgi:hypothetical protein